LRELLPLILRQPEVVIEDLDIFEEVIMHLEAIALLLEQELKRIKIFKFKVYLESDGEYLTNAIDQELKNFLSTSPLTQRNTNRLTGKQLNISLKHSGSTYTNCSYTIAPDFQTTIRSFSTCFPCKTSMDLARVSMTSSSFSKSNATWP
jgi:hypothetical protein